MTKYLYDPRPLVVCTDQPPQISDQPLCSPSYRFGPREQDLKDVVKQGWALVEASKRTLPTPLKGKAIDIRKSDGTWE